MPSRSSEKEAAEADPKKRSGLTEKYLFSIEVDPYDPNRQLSIINSNGGEPRYHFPIQGTKGLLVAKIRFEDVDKQQQDQDWVEGIHKGYYTVLNKVQG